MPFVVNENDIIIVYFVQHINAISGGSFTVGSTGNVSNVDSSVVGLLRAVHLAWHL